MRRHPKFFAALIFWVVAALVFFFGAWLSGYVGQRTHSGMLGICGPYGESAGLVGDIFFGSVPIAIIAGWLAARWFKRWLAKERND